MRLLKIENNHIEEFATYPIENTKKISLEFSENGKIFAIFMKMRNEVLVYNVGDDIETFFLSLKNGEAKPFLDIDVDLIIEPVIPDTLENSK